ncbi:MAG: acyltransferase family protein [Oscillospiraceae bacterium]|nr:acyltransferase family protein [Oscillospiraceae bacterium]
MIKRESNYDLLRIISAVAVIIIHVSATYFVALTDEESLGYINFDHAFVVCLYNVFSRFAVPCFVMLSGAFLLDDERNADYGYFYKKSFKNVGIPTIIFSALYFLFSILKSAAKIYIKNDDIKILANPFKNLIKGEPFYHMWYLYMLIGVYILIPVIIRLKNDIGEKKFEIVSCVFLILASLSLFTSSHKLHWDLGHSFCYCGYLMIGYTIRKRSSFNNISGICKLFCSAGILIALTFLRYRQACNGIADEDMKYSLIGPACPLIVIASVLIFSGLSNFNIKRDLGWLSSLTFLIYLFHAGIWDVLLLSIKLLGKQNIIADSVIFIPLFTVTVLIISIVCSVIYKKIWAKIENKIYKALKL